MTGIFLIYIYLTMAFTCWSQVCVYYLIINLWIKSFFTDAFTSSERTFLTNNIVTHENQCLTKAQICKSWAKID